MKTHFTGGPLYPNYLSDFYKIKRFLRGDRKPHFNGTVLVNLGTGVTVYGWLDGQDEILTLKQWRAVKGISYYRSLTITLEKMSTLFPAAFWAPHQGTGNIIRESIPVSEQQWNVLEYMEQKIFTPSYIEQTNKYG